MCMIQIHGKSEVKSVCLNHCKRSINYYEIVSANAFYFGIAKD